MASSIVATTRIGIPPPSVMTVTTIKTIEFPSTAGFKGWRSFFTKKSVAHPAKMNLNLLKWIIESYTEKGDVVLDPMAGTFSTAILASLLGRDGVGVELEERFVTMGKANKRKTLRQHSLTKRGNIMVLQGDARQLSKVLGHVDSIITSPPYSNRSDGGGIAKEGIGLFSHYSEEEAEAWFTKRKQDNIGNLPYGAVDSIITSPPYERTEVGNKDTVDTVAERLRKDGYSEDYIKANFMQPHGNIAIEHYSDNHENIGNLRSESYLEAMRQVYAECFATLKQGGKMVLVVKNFIRDKQVVDLAGDTIQLAESVGFTLTDHVLFKLPQLSFWRILYKKKHPEVDTSGIEYEHILVFTKQGDGGCVDSVITSPPYGNTTKNLDDIEKWEGAERIKELQQLSVSMMRPYSNNPDNIGNLPYRKSVSAGREKSIKGEA